MAEIKKQSDVMKDRTAYHAVRRSQASIALYRNFGDGDLSTYLERESFMEIATRLARHFFRQSTELDIFPYILELYGALLVMAPILQRLPLSTKFDWHRGHLLGFIRTNTCRKRGRYHVSIRDVPRTYQPANLIAALEQLGIRDSFMNEHLLDLYRRHAGGTTLKDCLAHQIFDPLLLSTMKEGFELRYGSQLIRLEKEAFLGSRDLRKEAVELLDFQVQSVSHNNGVALEIQITHCCLNTFKDRIKSILSTPSDAGFKQRRIEACIHDFVELTRHAHTALPQLQDLRQWLAQKLRHLAGNNADVKILPQVLVNHWLLRSDGKQYVKAPNFFLKSKQHDEKTYTTFFSPYREK